MKRLLCRSQIAGLALILSMAGCADKPGNAIGYCTQKGQYLIIRGTHATTIRGEGYCGLMPFRGNWVCFCIGGKWGVVDTETGAVRVPATYDAILEPENGVCNVQRGKLWGLMDAEGREILAPQYDWIGSFDEGRAGFLQNGKWGYLSPDGRVVIAPTYDDVRPFQEGRAAVYVGGQWGYINRDGIWVLPPQFEFAEDFSEGLASVSKDGSRGYVNRDGRIVIPFRHEVGLDFREGLAPAGSFDAMGFIDKDGHARIPPAFEQVGPFEQGVAPVQLGGKWGVIDQRGEWRILPRFDAISSSNDGASIVLLDDRFGYLCINSGEMILPPQFDDAVPFQAGMAAVKLNEKWAIITRNGKFLTSFMFDRVEHVDSAFPCFIGWCGKEGSLVDRTGAVRATWMICDPDREEPVHPTTSRMSGSE